MIVIPAIDLKDGRCVRLVEGRLDTERVVSEDAIAQARAFEAAGAERIHVVDLDGAFEGRPKHTELVRKVVLAVNVPVEVGGGLRDEAAVDEVLDAGAAFAILGTMAVTDPAMLQRICDKHPGRIIAGVDAKKGKVATEGWVSESELTTMDVAKRAEASGVSGVVTTDISRDGTGQGVNVEMTTSLAEALSVEVIASGGVSGLDDVRALLETPVFGVIVGRAIYDGSLVLEEAVQLCRTAESSPAST